MHKLCKIDIGLVLLTIIGSAYLYYNNQINFYYAMLIVFLYILAKLVGYVLLPYELFDTFINHLTKTSQLSFLSGFEIFKTTLVALLFLGFIFIDPSLWIIESILIVSMRIWGLSFIKNLKLPKN